ncbi:MAG: MBL fold metallo-hydrolase [Hyphomicrobiales bacterium]|nr:MBL fold metallo-hydrolase [Hyphomicrobiales bacterium]
MSRPSEGNGAAPLEGAPPPQLTELSPRLRRVIANNGGPFTFTGTCSYIVGRGEVAIVDPGPAGDEAHLDRLLDAIRGESLRHIVVTHTHRDHSPAARALKQATGAPIVGCGPHRPARPNAAQSRDRLDSGGDRDHVPDLLMREGDIISGPDWTLSAIATPGHTANHLAFALKEEKALLSGDHVMAWSTTVIAPPDGSMADYMASLQHLLTFDHVVYWPGHGGPVREPARYVRGLAAHRRRREMMVLDAVRNGAQEIDAIVEAAYPAIAPALAGAAGLSTLAHLEWLVERGEVISQSGQVSFDARYRPA